MRVLNITDSSLVSGDYLIGDDNLTLARFTGIITIASTIVSVYTVFTAAAVKKVLSKINSQ